MGEARRPAESQAAEATFAREAREVADVARVARQLLAQSRTEAEGRGALVRPGSAPEAEPGPPPSCTQCLPDSQEFLQVFQEYERYVASIGSRILGANNGVDDLVQEVFLVIYQEFHKLRELTSVKAWLAT